MTPDELTEKVALALYQDKYPGVGGFIGAPPSVRMSYEGYARAAILATLQGVREPTLQMMRAGEDARWQTPVIDERSAERIWERMLDVLIKELET